MNLSIDFSSIDYNQLDLRSIFWDEILEHGSSIKEEIFNQLWSFIFNSAWDQLPDSDLNEEEELELKKICSQYMESEKIKDWIDEKTKEISLFLEKK